MGTFFYRPAAGLAFDVEDRQNPPWLNYGAFEPVAEQQVWPNSFFAFAPNERSFHGAALDLAKWAGVRNKEARRTFLGFVTKGGANGFHHFQGGGDYSTDSFFI